MHIDEYVKLINSCADEQLDEYGIYPSNWHIVASVEYVKLLGEISLWKNWMQDESLDRKFANHCNLPIRFQVVDDNILKSPIYIDIIPHIDPSLFAILKTSLRFHPQDINSDISQRRGLVIAVTEISETFKKAGVSFCLPDSVPFGGDYSRLASYIHK